MKATSGVAKVSGIDVSRDPVSARARLSVVPQRVSIDRALRARQNLVFHAAYHGVPRAERNRRADALLEQFGLADRGGDKVDQYSGGMAQRLLIARALMHAPEVLFLDEPSTGLDPQARLFVWDRIRELRASGITIVMTTHDMDEAAALTDRVGIMDNGKLLALDSPAELTKSLPGSTTLDLSIEYADTDTGCRCHRSARRCRRRGAGGARRHDPGGGRRVARDRGDLRRLAARTAARRAVDRAPGDPARITVCAFAFTSPVKPHRWSGRSVPGLPRAMLGLPRSPSASRASRTYSSR